VIELARDVDLEAKVLRSGRLAALLPTLVDGRGSPGRGSLGTRIGQYELIRPLGRGGMGEVHLARDLRLGRLVAIKLLLTQEPDLDERFQAEAQATGRRIVSASSDRTVRVWHDLVPVTLEDPRLWAATSYCMPIERRIELLGVTEAQAGRDRLRCLERVERARERP
jgi:serine/threonine protein kinase